jgi:formate hydrogenlyase transcriptional activator
MSIAARPPRGFDVPGPYPRLVGSLLDGETSDAELWRAHSKLILDAAGEGIYGLDVWGRSIFVNPAAARMTGHLVEELLGKSMHEAVHHSHPDGSEYPDHSCPIYSAFKSGMIQSASDDVFWRKDGSSFPVEYTSTPLFNGKELVGAVVVFRDISLRQRTEDQLRSALSEVERLKEQLQIENRTLRREIESTRELSQLIGRGSGLRETMRLAERIAVTHSTVLIQGETGTGKELIARAIHRLSPRHDGPLVRVNCAAISSQLVESELFGHEKGAFTGAVQQRAGRFEQAHGGTLFLDEVGELPLETQAKLLRVLQERELERVGGNATLKVDVRVIAATNRDLRALVRDGGFRSDLYFRLDVVPIRVPRLRERRSDIPALADHFLLQLEQRWGRQLGRLSERALDELLAYEWPGNVRELANVIERAAILNDGGPIEVPSELLAFAAEAELSGGTSTAPRVTPASVERELPGPAPARAEREPLPKLADIERAHILRALEAARWRLAGPDGAGAVLGMHPNTLRHRMKKLRIER